MSENPTPSPIEAVVASIQILKLVLSALGRKKNQAKVVGLLAAKRSRMRLRFPDNDPRLGV